MSRISGLLLLLAAAAIAATPEVRGVWVARDSLGSQERLRETFTRLSEANFNTVFVNVWSRGYPLWRSEVFSRETGFELDPSPEFVGRDPLAEAVALGKEFAIAVVPWAEYGFVGGWSGYFAGEGGMGPIFEKHPDWLAKRRDGSVRFPVGSGCCYFWMAHANPEVQRFLADLMAEIAAKYDVPAIQFDRARYPELDCGYDEATVALYAAQHEGQRPPDDPRDARWVAWRAAQLNQFHSMLMRRIRDANWRALVTNAPVVYPFSYVNFAQEYPAWVRQGSLDFVSPQIYRSDFEGFQRELDAQIQHAGGAARLVAGIDASNTRIEVVIRSIELARQRKLPGVVIWFYGALASSGSLARLKEAVFEEPAPLPWK
ncbi:MAG: family 10 glycosylhydrolase [Bryobacterales bacterium]|nr:family 10 glycosylhydrolase [Bryobacterales bacterium]